jgi:hypothetical protein
MTDGVPPLEPLRPRRRMLPSVSDVVRELGLTTTADAPTLFKIARQVCAEELNRVKQGFESEPLEVLVARAEKLLDPATLKTPPAPAPAPPSDLGVEGPFAETAATAGLKWGGEAKEPFGEALAPAEAPGGHMASDAGLEEPFGASEPFELAEEEAPRTESFSPEIEASTAHVSRFVPKETGAALEAPTGTSVRPARFAAEAPLAGTAEPLPPTHVLEEGPGEDMLAGLRADAEGLDLERALPRREEAAEKAGSLEPASAYVDRSEPVSRRDTTLPELMIETKPRRKGPLVAVLLGIAVAIGVFALRKLGGPAAAPAPTPVPAVAPAAEPPKRAPEPAVEPVSTPPKTMTAAPAGRSTAAEPSSSRLPVSKGFQLVTSDWSGAPIFVVHVGSYKDRPSAEREAEALAKKTGRSAHAFEVNLGEKGTWFRSAVGEFASADEAAAFKKELEAQAIARVGLVYKVTAAER